MSSKQRLSPMLLRMLFVRLGRCVLLSPADPALLARRHSSASVDDGSTDLHSQH